MKTLLELFVKYFDFLYLDANCRITDSATSELADANARLQITSPRVSWEITNDRGRFQLAIAPTQRLAPEYWFLLPIVREYLDGEKDKGLYGDGIDWLRQNVSRIEDLFSDQAAVIRSCSELQRLEVIVAERNYGPP